MIIDYIHDDREVLKIALEEMNTELTFGSAHLIEDGAKLRVTISKKVDQEIIIKIARKHALLFCFLT
ncbi:hypothetical protein [Brevibacillus sp. 179-C9.3 HS]|uniref:hypothetical protein n=1 Tax=unclassified Brevibacillus TaxID=2684853 RepID=UPI0039A0373D